VTDGPSQIVFVVEGRPVSWARLEARKGKPLFGRQRERSDQMKSAKAMLAARALGALACLRGGRSAWPLEGAFSVSIRAFYPTAVMGDVDRLAGLPLDALEGIAYRTDRQVTTLSVVRLIDRERPRVEVAVWRLPEVAATPKKRVRRKAGA
jgi:Holliday junction resolvase RusA-like endonuclease